MLNVHVGAAADGVSRVLYGFEALSRHVPINSSPRLRDKAGSLTAACITGAPIRERRTSRVMGHADRFDSAAVASHPIAASISGWPADRSDGNEGS